MGAIAVAFSDACSSEARASWGIRLLPPPLFVGLAALLILFASSWQPYEMVYRRRDEGRIDVQARRLLGPTLTRIVPHEVEAEVDVLEHDGEAWKLVGGHVSSPMPR